PARLTTLRDKYTYLAQLGVDYVLCLRFNRHFAQFTAAQFASTLLVHKLAVQYLMVGDDFQFGKDRTGDFALLQQLAEKHHFQLVKAGAVYLDKQRVSSTHIRQLLQTNQLAEAAKFLGRPYSINGRVIQGQALARTLGFQKAKIKLNRLNSPVNGVNTITVYIKETRFYGMANIGYRPTVMGKELLLEAHLFHFDDNLYGQCIDVILCEKLRDEKKFASLDELKTQIMQDKLAAQERFNIN